MNALFAEQEPALLQELAALQKRAGELEEAVALRKRQETLCRETNRRFHALVETASDWIWEIDSDWRYTYASPKIEDLLGYSVPEVIGKSPFDFMAPAEKERIALEFLKVAAARQPFSRLENVNRHRDGRTIVLETTGVPVLGPGGELLGYRGFDRNISERKSSEQALRTSQAQLADAMELAHIYYWEIDPISRMFIFNDPFYAFNGTSVALEGGYRMSMEECTRRFIHPDDRQYFAEQIGRNAVRTEAEFTFDVEYRIIRRDGEVRHVMARTRFVRASSGRPFRVYGAAQDITEYKLIEQDRERLILELKEALAQVRTLSGLLPVCSDCKKIRDDAGQWQTMESYIRAHSRVDFSHGLCPECAQRLYPKFFGNKGR